MRAFDIIISTMPATIFKGLSFGCTHVRFTPCPLNSSKSTLALIDLLELCTCLCTAASVLQNFSTTLCKYNCHQQVHHEATSFEQANFALNLDAIKCYSQGLCCVEVHCKHDPFLLGTGMGLDFLFGRQLDHVSRPAPQPLSQGRVQRMLTGRGAAAV